MTEYTAPLRLRLDGDALVHNWRTMARLSGSAACGAAIKADGYGLGARAVMARLARAGCRDFWVATWAEAAALMPVAEGLTLSVLHGVREGDLELAAKLTSVVPVLNSIEQIGRWVSHFAGRRCSAMFDTGMNRLGVEATKAGEVAAAGLNLDTVMSHLACADEDSTMNEGQRERFEHIAMQFPRARKSLANSAGIALGADYAFGLTRPGLALYGGIARPELAEVIRPVMRIEAEILQLRTVRAGETIGYNATFTASEEMSVALVNLGYADGFWRALGPDGVAEVTGEAARIVGSVSMDLIALALAPVCEARAGDWARFDFDLAECSCRSHMSAYELLTGLGARFERRWG